MKRLLLILPAAALAAALLMAPAPTCAQSGYASTQMGCGFKPMKPMVPMGCKDLVAECRCDARGQRCRWEWICVKR